MRSTIKYGVLTAAISIISLFGSFTLFAWLKGQYGWGIQASTFRGVAGLISIPIQAIGIYLAMQDVKKVTGQLTYGQAIKAGLTVAITIAVLLALFSFIYCQFINPGYAEYMVKDAQKAMIANGAGQQDLVQGLADVAKQYTTGAQVFQALVGQFVTGAIVSVIIGLFIRTKK